MLESNHKLTKEEYSLLERLINKQELIPSKTAGSTTVSLRHHSALSFRNISFWGDFFVYYKSIQSMKGYYRFVQDHGYEVFRVTDRGIQLYEENKKYYHNINKE